MFLWNQPVPRLPIHPETSPYLSYPEVFLLLSPFVDFRLATPRNLLGVPGQVGFSLCLESESHFLNSVLGGVLNLFFQLNFVLHSSSRYLKIVFSRVTSPHPLFSGVIQCVLIFHFIIIVYYLYITISPVGTVCSSV